MRAMIELLEGILPKTSSEKSAGKVRKMRSFRRIERGKQRRDEKGGSAYKRPTADQKNKGWRKEEEWDADLCMFMVAKMFESGDLDEGLIYTRADAKERGEPVGMFFRPPRNIRKIAQDEFPDAEKLWWEAVTELLKVGSAFDLSDPKKLKPLFGKVMSIWKDKVDDQYGYRPSRSDEASLQQDIDRSIRAAARAMRMSRSGSGVDKKALSRAARAMRARRSVA